MANQKIHQLWEIFPLLKEEILGEGNFGNDYVKLTFPAMSSYGYIKYLGNDINFPKWFSPRHHLTVKLISW